jgi:hypothetical protein
MCWSASVRLSAGRKRSPSFFAVLVDHVPAAAQAAKLPGLWMWPLQAWVTRLHAPFITDFTGFDQPWRQLARHVPDLHIRELAFGAGYLALGHAHNR